MAAIALSAKIQPSPGRGTQILRLTTDRHVSAEERKHSAFLLGEEAEFDQAVASFPEVISIGRNHQGALELSESYGYLASGDIIRLRSDKGDLRVVYRRNSRHNVLFVTEQCNSRCVMCSQPPRRIDDSYLIDEVLSAIPLMAGDTPQLCITGGEPTLNMAGLLRVVSSVKQHLPTTHLHMLSNGRSFKDQSRASDLTALSHPDFTIGIPLYSDQASKHDFIVQAKGAFDETILGLLNLAAFGQKIEIRIVIHRLSVPRLVATAIFIARNLPFACHVALMGLEPTGFGKTNLEALWIDPWDYREELSEAVRVLGDSGINVSIYNHQLCILPEELWKVAAQSISDWKNIYVDECEKCFVRTRCAGFFASSREIVSTHVKAISGSNCNERVEL